MVKKKAVIFTGGLGPEFNQVEEVIKNADMFVAADSGWDLAKRMGIVPDYFIGDMDSISNKDDLNELDKSKILAYPSDKDYTDTELAVKFLKDKEYEDIILVGGGEGRLDHLLAIVLLFSSNLRPSEWYTAVEHIILCSDTFYMECEKNQNISVFPCLGKNAEVSSNGLKWELKNFKLNHEKYSISNRTIKDELEIKVHSGDILIITNY
ncbi:MAG: thiamine diphosphokinase [Spirochaetales bacterium]|nr:thiamine diphosphokinase [Spirochaetales bacterium]